MQAGGVVEEGSLAAAQGQELGCNTYQKGAKGRGLQDMRSRFEPGSGHFF